MMRKLERGRYTATHLRWGKALEIDGNNRAVLMGQDLLGGKNQQWEFIPCGAGFTINNVLTGSFLTARDLKRQGMLEVVMGAFPTCWELEAMDNRNAEDGAEDENGDVYVRMRLPHSEMALSLGQDGRQNNYPYPIGGTADAPICLANSREDLNTYWRLSPLVRQQAVNTRSISTTTTMMTPTTITTTPTTVTITTAVTRTVAGDV